jgi:threonine/homoserine/homoserine lactone efflux protein
VDIGVFARGLLIGFSIAAPVGPIGVLCIRRTVADGRTRGFVSGLGAATADGLYGAVAAFGLTAISDTLVSQQTALRLVGGLFLCYLGVRTFLSRPAERPAEAGRQARGLVGAWASTFALTVTNPLTILSFVAIFAGLGVATDKPSYGASALVVTGVFVGSAAWWFILSGGVSLLRGLDGSTGSPARSSRALACSRWSARRPEDCGGGTGNRSPRCRSITGSGRRVLEVEPLVVRQFLVAGRAIQRRQHRADHEHGDQQHQTVLLPHVAFLTVSRRRQDRQRPRTPPGRPDHAV